MPLAFFLTLFLALPSNAYFVASYGSALHETAPTNIFVVGYSHGLGRRLLEAAAGSALRIRSAFPEHQVVFLVIEENKESRADLERLGLSINQAVDAKLSPEALLERLKSFSRIASIELFTHSHILWGAGLEGLGKNQRISHETSGISSLRPNFLPNAYVFFHGCNAGFVIAPALAELWGIPVAGALSSTSIERLAEDGRWYLDEKDAKPATVRWARRNAVSYATSVPCSRGACIRMRPDNHPYFGKYGKFSRGLGFYRFFCPEGKKEECGEAMSLSLLAFPAELALSPASPEIDFDRVLGEFLCSSVTSAAKNAACRNALRGDPGSVVDGFLGSEPYCTREFCEVDVECSGLCRVGGARNEHRDLLGTEYGRYRK